MRLKLTILHNNGKKIRGRDVHLRQGDADGACGPYCILMALIAAGIETRDRIISLSRSHGNSNFEKLMGKFDNKSGRFFADGTMRTDLVEFLSHYRKIQTASIHGGSSKVRTFLVDHIKQNHPVILGLPSHWVLATGISETHDNQLVSIYALDPGREPLNKAWNLEIEGGGTGSPKPFLVLTDGSKVAFDDAFALWPV